MTLHPETLPGDTEIKLRELGRSRLMEQAYLAGGTAIALHLGHRISRDLDFFTSTRFEESILSQQLEEIGLITERSKGQTILGKMNGVHFSYFFYKYPLLFKPISFHNVSITDLRDCAAMKLEAIAARGTIRDFVDLHAIMQHRGMTLLELFSFHQQKYLPQHDTAAHALRSLTYFVNAEEEHARPLEMLTPIHWESIKAFFIEKVAREGKLLLMGETS